MDDNAKYNELKDKLKSVGCTFDMDKYNLKGFIFPDEYDHILCEYLGTFEKCRYKSRIVHCLAKPKKYKMIPVLLKEYDNNNVYETWTNQYRWYLSDALHRIGYNDNFFNEYMKIINNKQYGKAREPIVSLLGRSKRHEALEKLAELLHDWDHDVMWGILEALNLFKRRSDDVYTEVRLFADRLISEEGRAKYAQDMYNQSLRIFPNDTEAGRKRYVQGMYTEIIKRINKILNYYNDEIPKECRKLI